MAEKREKFNLRRWLDDRLDLATFLSSFSLTGWIYGPLDRRLNLRQALEKALRKPIPTHVNWLYCFGGITLFLFGLQVLTGIMLAIYYKPTPHDAYASILYIDNVVPLGWLARQVHAWCGHLLLLMLFLHMARVFFHRAYRSPRELNWVVGVLLLIVCLTFGFTGSLLPWDQWAYWSTTTGTETIGGLPILGETFLKLLRGGEGVTDATLTRFFALHALILPWLITFLLVLHFAMVRRQGISEPL